MTKKKDNSEVPDAVEVTELTPPKVYNKRAYSVLQRDGKYHLVCVSYNEQLEVGSATIMESDLDSFDIHFSLEQAIEEMMND